MFRYEYRTMRVPKLSRHDCITQYPVVRKILILNFVVVKWAMPVNAHIASYGMLRVRKLFHYLCIISCEASCRFVLEHQKLRCVKMPVIGRTATLLESYRLLVTCSLDIKRAHQFTCSSENRKYFSEFSCRFVH